MKKIFWSDKEVTTVARKLREIVPTVMINKIKSQMKGDHSQKVFGFTALVKQAQAVLPTDRQKNGSIDAPNIERLKKEILRLRPGRKIAEIQNSPTIKQKAKKLDENILEKLKSADTLLRGMGINAANRAKVLNDILSKSKK